MELRGGHWGHGLIGPKCTVVVVVVVVVVVGCWLLVVGCWLLVVRAWWLVVGLLVVFCYLWFVIVCGWLWLWLWPFKTKTLTNEMPVSMDPQMRASMIMDLQVVCQLKDCYSTCYLRSVAGDPESVKKNHSSKKHWYLSCFQHVARSICFMNAPKNKHQKSHPKVSKIHLHRAAARREIWDNFWTRSCLYSQKLISTCIFTSATLIHQLSGVFFASWSPPAPMCLLQYTSICACGSCVLENCTNLHVYTCTNASISV